MKSSHSRYGLDMIFFLLSISLMTFFSCDPNAGLYHTYDEIDQELHDLADNYPETVKVLSIGKSIENRDLWAIKISNNVALEEAEPTIIFLGCHHAREWISVDVPFLIAKHLIENYSVDMQIAELVDNAEIWVVPLINPDGHQHSVMKNRYWRKNRRDNGDGTFGVDLNRNYGYEWGGPGSSGDTFSGTYRGPSAFSEPETQAVRDFLQAQSPTALITYHSFGNLVMYPWGYTKDPAPDHIMLKGISDTMAEEIMDVHGVSYTSQQGSDLYLSSGGTIDWLYGEQVVPGFTIELRPSFIIPNFVLPENQIQPTFEENLPAALFLIEWAIDQEP